MCASAERDTGRLRLRRCVQSETGWVKKLSYLLGLGICMAGQVNATVYWQASVLHSKPGNASLKFTKHLNSYIKLACFPIAIKQSDDTKTGTFLLFAHLLLRFTLYYRLSHIKNSSQKELFPKEQLPQNLEGLHWQWIQPVL